MKKRDTYKFLVKTAHQVLTANGILSKTTFDIREFVNVKKCSQSKREYRQPKTVSEAMLRVSRIGMLEFADDVDDNVVTGDEYIPSEFTCPENLRFDTRAAAVMNAVIMGLDVYEFKKNKIPHPLTFKTIRECAKPIV